MKKIPTLIVCVTILSITLFFQNKITDFFISMFDMKYDVQYEVNQVESFEYVAKVNDFTPYSKKDIQNIFYTLVSTGREYFTFYCPSEYENCVTDVTDFSQNQELLTHINNYIHPFYSFSEIKTTVYESGSVQMQVYFLYSESMITRINQYLDAFIEEHKLLEKTDRDKIRYVHDYIINNAKYDVERNETKDSPYQSYLAIGALFEGYATCNGYTDAMSMFLYRFGIKNYKIATDMMNQELEIGHVWNAVYLDNKWLHLDLTWDDPVTNTGEDVLQHKYFLITDEELVKLDNQDIKILEHIYPKHIYLEFKKTV